MSGQKTTAKQQPKKTTKVTMVQAIIAGTVIALILHTVMVVRHGYANTVLALTQDNHQAVLALAKRNLAIASMLACAFAGAKLTGATAGAITPSLIQSLNEKPLLHKMLTTAYARQLLKPLHWAGKAWVLLVLTFKGVLIKAASIIASIGLLLAAAALGLLDGLSRRYVRTVEGGRESTYIYHKALASSRSIPSIALILYVLIPNPIAPECAVLLLAWLVFSLVRLTSSQFKKYL